MSYSPHVEDVLNHPEVDAVTVTCETDRHRNGDRGGGGGQGRSCARSRWR
ncbi:MAG: hypothetical protein R2856_32295 [Caldilineaceae bacterium]